jgi:hypothetical protein
VSRETLRSKIRTSVHGRRLGLAQGSSAQIEYLVGPDGIQSPHGAVLEVQAATSDTTATNITAYGLTTVDTSTDDTWLLDPPIVGVSKLLYTGSTSTGIRTIKRSDSSFALRTSANSTTTTIVAQGGGLFLQLIGVSSAIYAIVSRPTGFSSACSTEMALNGTT